MAKVRLAFLWHMHQPLYRAPETGEFLLPWVRLHATRAYYDMAWMLERHPAIRCTVNFTPVLMEQLEAYARGEARDRFLDLSRKRARELLPEERQAVLRSFFMIDWETVVKPMPRYWELLQKRGRDVRYLDLARVASGFSEAELADLQVLFNLGWFGFGAVEDDPGLAALRAKGRGYTEADLDYVLAAQRRVVGEIAPRWRALSERGQVELSSTPYYHPILPLVCDTDSARRALPHLPLPPRFAWPEDARWHVREAIASHERHFGARPAGMWPAEGSVSPEALELLASEGVRWAATDEGVLLHSLPEGTPRPRALYRPWRVQAGARELPMLFRDRGLSDLIGFSYQRTGAAEAAADFTSHLAAIGEAWEDDGQPGPATVGVFLDGENPWEHFQGSGRDFLEALYRRLESSPDLATATLTEATAGAPGPVIPRIHSGSWIEASYRIWMGHEEDRRAWTALGRAREALARVEAAPAPSVTREAIALAHRHLYAAEGSDWYWWYGDDFHTELAVEFDGLFRSYVIAACQLIGAPLPIEALEPIKRAELPAGAEAQPLREPTLLITPTIDGRETTYFEWQGGGVYRPGQARGSMFGGAQAFEALRYGFDLGHLYLRLDPVESPQRATEACSAVRVELLATGVQAQVDFTPACDGVERPGRRDGAPLGRAAFARVMELALPFAELGLAPGERVALALHVLRGGVELERLPRAGYVTLTVPDQDFERIHWRV
ncbi:glycoside hydrolase family 57 protein [Anaeromyxobacter diazotrophicus]|uniref:Glycoside hydrolase n=1 Tax=Anaeromyxobacter diazotrophicus TaxID=2590199 RepID=A0A7I9VQG5_9BACT|nr:glycoside hydrolase family 57 protein [Anaeromyxobacter diazotrophicus]GEJ58645.1 glycoside hydrolase [Anaeromyxobacter diazotrophicus]